MACLMCDGCCGGRREARGGTKGVTGDAPRYVTRDRRGDDDGHEETRKTDVMRNAK